MSLATLSILSKLKARSSRPLAEPSSLATFEGISNGRANFVTIDNDRVSIPLKNVITNQALNGTFVLVRPNYSNSYAYKEIK
jgi:hypothetical protein